MSAPAVVCRDTIVVGVSISDGPTSPEHTPGDVRGFDVRTGEVWTFHSVPRAGAIPPDFGGGGGASATYGQRVQ